MRPTPRGSSMPTVVPVRTSTRPLAHLEDVALGGLEEEALMGSLAQRLDEPGSVFFEALLEPIEVRELMEEGNVAAELSFMFGDLEIIDAHQVHLLSRAELEPTQIHWRVVRRLYLPVAQGRLEEGSGFLRVPGGEGEMGE